MDGAEDRERVVAALAERLSRLTFMDKRADEVTALLVETVVDWAAGQGWRVYRRAASVMPLPPPYAHRRSVVDVACARPSGPPVVVEVDRSERQRTVDKLRAEIAAGRIGIWVRWGDRDPGPPPAGVPVVAYRVTSHRAPGGGRVHSRHAADRPAPSHHTGEVTSASQPELFP